MGDRVPIASNPVAVVIVALVGWIAICLVLDLLRQAGVSLDQSSTPAGWEAGYDGAYHRGGFVDHAGDGTCDGGGEGD